MRCRHCGAEIGEELSLDAQARCPECGKRLAPGKNKKGSGKKRAARRKRRQRRLILFSLVLTALVCIAIALLIGILRMEPPTDTIHTPQTAASSEGIGSAEETETALSQEADADDPLEAESAGTEYGEDAAEPSPEEEEPDESEEEEAGKADESEAMQPEETAVPEATEAPEAEEAMVNRAASAHIRAVGDLMCHDKQLELAKSKKGYNFYPQFERVKDALSSADYTIGNLELTIAKNDFRGYPTFRTPYAYLETIKDAGIDFVTMSNNHQLDAGYDGLVNTVTAVEYAGLDHVGGYRSQEERDTPVIVEVNGIKFGFLAYTYGSNRQEKHVSKKQLKYCVSYLSDADYAGDVKRLREAGAEVVVCLPHWGDEYNSKVVDSQRQAAQKMASAGVDIILGSHPHVIQPIEMIDCTTMYGEQKTVLVAWSMGNFISNMSDRYSNCGIIVDFTVERDEDGKCTVKDPGYVPVFVWKHEKFLRVVCSGDYYSEKPEDMRKKEYKLLTQSADDTIKLMKGKGIALLQH